jgi:preprotein translocase subunit SecA
VDDEEVVDSHKAGKVGAYMVAVGIRGRGRDKLAGDSSHHRLGDTNVVAGKRRTHQEIDLV